MTGERSVLFIHRSLLCQHSHTKQCAYSEAQTHGPIVKHTQHTVNLLISPHVNSLIAPHVNPFLLSAISTM
ncbi:unnamed protein product [Staurois parvus]|uniref:Uncharacterized protein n=1 Tax=Staurois parvus TaxID=386267 RepID=A0ABN9E2G1_9NEOB|nr:unnamed protein product [Staurois parvus]